MNKEVRKEYREYLTIADKRVLDAKKSGIELIADDEVFVLVKNTHNYETVALSYWDTPEEAFAEYKRVKQADILMMATKYKNKIPKHVYEALTKYEVKPFVED